MAVLLYNTFRQLLRLIAPQEVVAATKMPALPSEKAMKSVTVPDKGKATIDR